MRLSRITIENFRNFKLFDVQLGEHAVVIGENKVGKTNLLFALRLLIDPAVPDSMRRLRFEDFGDGLPRPQPLRTKLRSLSSLLDFKTTPFARSTS